MKLMLLPLKKYADFSGRSSRREYWMFALFSLLVYAGLGAIWLRQRSDQAGLRGRDFGLLLLIAYTLAIMLPSLAVTVRRFHDQEKSGSFVLLGLIPYFGSLFVILFMLFRGTRGPNRFGPDPTDVSEGGESSPPWPLA